MLLIRNLSLFNPVCKNKFFFKPEEKQRHPSNRQSVDHKLFTILTILTMNLCYKTKPPSHQVKISKEKGRFW